MIVASYLNIIEAEKGTCTSAHIYNNDKSNFRYTIDAELSLDNTVKSGLTESHFSCRLLSRLSSLLFF